MTPLPATDSASPREIASCAVLDHLGRYVEPGFAGDENDAAPAVLHHAREIVAGETNAAHDIGVEEPLPILVGDGLEGLRLEDAEIVNQDVGIAHARKKGRDTFRCR